MPPSNDPAALVERWNEIIRGYDRGETGAEEVYDAGNELAAALEQQVRRVKELYLAADAVADAWRDNRDCSRSPGHPGVDEAIERLCSVMLKMKEGRL